MSIQNRSVFQNSLDEETSYRKREISILRFLSSTNDPQYEKEVINRLIVPHIYSHYEGFIKNTSILYLNYIISTFNPTRQIDDNIFALHMRKKIISSSKSNKCYIHIDLIKDIRIQPSLLDFMPEKIINTHSNLKSEHLKEIMVMCGIEFDAYWQNKSFFIDNLLLKYRNLIAHGERVSIDDATVNQCLSNVLDIIEKYKTELENKL
jgi:hypothetical protein